MANVVVVGLARTPYGRYRGAYANVRVDELLARLMRQWQHHWAGQGVASFVPQWVLTGCANQAGEDSRNLARQVALLAGLPASTVGITLNSLCLSGVDALIMADMALKAGQARTALVTAAEVMSRAPVAALPGQARGEATVFGWRMTHPAFEASPHKVNVAAQVDALAENAGISRAVLDDLVVTRVQQAQHLAPLAQRYVLPVTSLTQDEALLQPLEKRQSALQRGRPLGPYGHITTHNSAPFADGALLVALSTQEEADRQGWPVLLPLNGIKRGAGPVAAYATQWAALYSQWATASARASTPAASTPLINEAFSALPLLGAAQCPGLHEVAQAPVVASPLAVGVPQSLAGLHVWWQWAVQQLVAELPPRPGALIEAGMGQWALF